LASYLPILDYTLYVVQYDDVREFYEKFVDFYTMCTDMVHKTIFIDALVLNLIASGQTKRQ